MHTDAVTKKKFESPSVNRKYFKSAISPKFKTNLKDFGKSFKQKGELGAKHCNLAKKKLLTNKSGKGTLPVKYHLGGNSSDPLNLNELIDRDPSISVTPQCSPAVALVERDPDEVIDFEPVGLDKKDPLHLENASPFHHEDMMKIKKKKKRKRNNSCYEPDEKDQENIETETFDQNVKSPKAKRKRSAGEKMEKKEQTEEKIELKEKVEEVFSKGSDEESEKAKKKKKKKSEKKSESENEEKTEKTADLSVVMTTENVDIDEKKCEGKNGMAQEINELSGESEKTIEKKEITPTKHKKKHKHSHCTETHHQFKPNFTSKSQKKDKKFIYGNYNRYYGYRNPDKVDVRLQVFREEWFNGKRVLDIGCNTGEVTLAIARDYNPALIIGNDIDESLIKIAQKNLQQCAISKQMSSFPVSFALSYGPVMTPSVLTTKGAEDISAEFPHNVLFKQQNFVPPTGRDLTKEEPNFDAILCLSVTKWVHLNWGDEGLKRMFKKIFLLLKPGGLFILELQPFSSYRKRKNLTEKIRQNFDNMQFMPEQFTDYLLSSEVGFAAYEILDVPMTKYKGFQRPMYLFTKANKAQQQHDLMGDWY